MKKKTKIILACIAACIIVAAVAVLRLFMMLTHLVKDMNGLFYIKTILEPFVAGE